MQMGDIESILKIIELMKAKEMPVSPAIFEARMLAHSRNGWVFLSIIMCIKLILIIF